MAYASVVRSPVPGGSVVELDDGAARSMAGVIDVVVIPQSSVGGMLGETLSTEAVAVVADSYWTANEAVKTLQVIWSETGFESVDSDGIYAQFELILPAEQNDRAIGSRVRSPLNLLLPLV